MPTRYDIKRLLSKGLSGWEAGVLVFEDSWLESKGAGFLTDRDIELLKSSLKSQQDAQDYNRLIGAYRIADFIERQADMAIMSAAYFLERVAGIGYLEFSSLMTRIALRSMPLPVTEKELKSLKAQQRRRLLNRYYCLEQVISWRAYALASEVLREAYDEDEMAEEAPELYQQAEAEIQALIESGKLKPVKLDILPFSEEVKSGERQDIEWCPRDSKCNTPEQIERLLQTYIQGSQLYKRGLPEWKEWIDTFKTYLLEKEHWLTDDIPPYVAIVQEPQSHDLDKRGHFKKDFMNHWPLRDSSQDSRPLTEISSDNAELAISQIKKALVRRKVLEELGRVIGLALEQAIDFGIDTILEPSLGRYNLFASDMPSELRRLLRQERLTEEERNTAFEQMRMVDKTPGAMLAYMGELKLPLIKLDQIRLPAKELAEVRGWIAESLGDRWWERVSQTAKEPRPVLPEDVLERWKSVRQENEQEAKDGS